MNEGTSRDHPVRSTFLAMEIIFAPGRSTWVAQIGIGKATFLTLRGTRTRQRKRRYAAERLRPARPRVAGGSAPRRA